MFGKLLLVLAALQVTHAFGGNERGGGVSPAPIFMPEDVTYVCSVRHIQLGAHIQIHRALESQASVEVSWKKGEYGGARRVELKDIAQWKHFEMKKSGPFGYLPEEVPTAPATARFEGALHFTVEHLASPPEVGIVLTTQVSSTLDPAQVRVAEAYGAEPISSTSPLTSYVRYIQRGQAGGHNDERSLRVRCERK